MASWVGGRADSARKLLMGVLRVGTRRPDGRQRGGSEALRPEAGLTQSSGAFQGRPGQSGGWEVRPGLGSGQEGFGPRTPRTLGGLEGGSLQATSRSAMCPSGSLPPAHVPAQVFSSSPQDPTIFKLGLALRTPTHSA